MKSYRVSFLVCVSCETAELNSSVEPKNRSGRQTQAKTEAFYEALEANVKCNTSALSFRILVWGPGSNAFPETFRKRHEIREALSVTHETKFSEDFPSKIPAMTAEHLQITKWKQLLIMIVDSPGSIVELSSFQHQIGKGCLIWFQTKHLKGLAATLLDDIETNGGKIEYYDETDVKVCVLKKMSELWVSKCQQREYLLKERVNSLNEEML